MLKQICFQSGNDFGRWIKGMIFIFLKIVGVIRTGKLRDIVIFEDNLNFSNKLYFGIRLMEREEISGVILQEQHGGRLVHTSMYVAPLRDMLFDYVRQTGKNAVI